ncbi:hypothetical protein HBI16_061230 [Parastagonospora nodorum]|nr:hypothetical protein HBI16_061230 [Parastagonospora nodorum]
MVSMVLLVRTVNSRDLTEACSGLRTQAWCLVQDVVGDNIEAFACLADNCHISGVIPLDGFTYDEEQLVREPQ